MVESLQQSPPDIALAPRRASGGGHEVNLPREASLIGHGGAEGERSSLQSIQLNNQSLQLREELVRNELLLQGQN